MNRHIGDLVRLAREHRGYSQRVLAELADTQQSAISELETGLHPPNINTFLRLMDVMSYDVEVLIRPRGDMPWSAQFAHLHSGPQG